VFERRLDRDAIVDAVKAGVINDNEAGIMRAADEATERAVHVDDFDKDVLKHTEPRAAAE
jgi:acyl-CoA dehydrogenase